MALPGIATTTPTVTPVVASITYDKWWLANCSIIATDPTNVKALLTYKKYMVDANGNVVFSPVDPAVIIEVDDLLNSTDVNIQAALQAVLVASTEIGIANGLGSK